MVEMWRAVTLPIYCERYLVSNFGRVKTTYTRKKSKCRLLNPHFNKRRNYFYVMFEMAGTRKNVAVHRLVALAFVPKTDTHRDHVNHIDFNTKNNHASNLEWVTPSENLLKSRMAGRYKPQHGELCGAAKLTNKKVLSMRGLFEAGFKHREIAEKYGVATCTVTQIINRQRWSHI